MALGTQRAEGEMSKMYDWLELQGKVAIVTGAVGGIGEVVALELAKAGAKVAIVDVDQVRCDAGVSKLVGGGMNAVGIACDISSAQSVEAMVERVESELGEIDVLVNNAAIARAGSLADLPIDLWNQMISVNLTGYFLCSQAVGRKMIERRRGSIIHVSSISGQIPQAYSAGYSICKAGVSMLSKNLAVEWGEFGVRSNVVCPAIILTPMSAAMYADPEIKAKREGAIPMRRIGMPQDIAEAILFFASSRSGFVTGEELLVDGGLRQNMLTLIPRPGFEKKPD